MVAVARHYENRYDDIADPSVPLRRVERIYEEATGGYQPPASSLTRSEKSRTTTSTNPRAAVEYESENDKTIKRLDRDVDTLGTQNKTLRTESQLRARQIKGLEDLLDAEREALQEVLEAARENIREEERKKVALLAEAADEREKRLVAQQEMQTMQLQHRTQVDVFETHIGTLREAIKAANEQKAAAVKKNEEDLLAQREHYESIVASLREQMAAAEQRFEAEKGALTMANERLRSTMRIWQEVISKLRYRVKCMDGWIFGFQMWRYNVEYDISNQEREIEMDIRPEIEDYDIGGWNIKDIASAEFGL